MELKLTFKKLPQHIKVNNRSVNCGKIQNVFRLVRVYENRDKEVKKDLLNSAPWNFFMFNGEIASVQYRLPYKYMNDASKSGYFSICLDTREFVGTFY